MNSTGRALQTTPDASRQRRSKSEGINAATTDAQSANSSPTPQFSTAGENYQGKKIGKTEYNNLQQPVDGSSPKSNEEAYDNRKKGSALEPEQLDHNLTYQPRHSLKKTGQRHVEPEQQEIQQQHRT